MDVKTKKITVSMTDTEKSVLVKLAEYEGRLSLNATIRHLIIDAARARKLKKSSNKTSIVEEGTSR